MTRGARGHWYAVAGVAGIVLLTSQAAGAPRQLPVRLSDVEFWRLTERLSESPGPFSSENYISNERGFQLVIPDLLNRVPRAQVYVGVGPEQNFSYLAAVRPLIAFIVDVRRANLVEHLLYKALFELSHDRADFLSRLFSRARPPILSEHATAAELFDAYERAEPRPELYEQNLETVIARLTGSRRFPLTPDDLQALRGIYRYAFFTRGPALAYATRGGDGGLAPTYQELMSSDDGKGVNRSYLASEESFLFVRMLEAKNLIVPLVGDFAGSKAVRAIGDFARGHGATISVFYASNVEDYLAQDNRWGAFCRSVATMPLDRSSTFVFAGGGGPAGTARTGGLETHLRPILPAVERCN